VALVIPSSIEPGRAPGGLYAALFVDGELVDGAALVDEVTDVEGVAVRHAGAALSAERAGVLAAVGIYDGDTGELVMPLRAGGELRQHRPARRAPRPAMCVRTPAAPRR
jgi:hypothetical protein